MKAAQRAEIAFRWLARASEIGALEWDRLASRGFHLHRWFEVCEAGGRLEARHLALEAAGELRVVIPSYLETSALHGDLHDRWLGPARGLLNHVGVRLRPTLVVNAPFANASDPLGDLTRISDEMLAHAFEVLEEMGRRERVKAVVWPYVRADRSSLLEVAARLGYGSVFSGSTAVLDVSYDTFETYLDTRSKSVRRTIKADLAALREPRLRLLSTPDFRPWVAEMDELFRSAFTRRNGRAPDLEPTLFDRLADAPTAQVWAQLCWRDGRLAGMSLNVAAGATLDGTFAAFTRREQAGAVYFNDLIYEPMRKACAMRMTRIDTGPSSLYPKVLRGAKIVPRVTLFRGTSRPVHTALLAWGRLVERRVRFKERRSLGLLAVRARSRVSHS